MEASCDPTPILRSTSYRAGYDLLVDFWDFHRLKVSVQALGGISLGFEICGRLTF